MDMYPKYTSPFGYQVGDNSIDSYGVDHSGFTTRDEVEYQFARDKREQDLMRQYNDQGITSNYPQYTTNFWGNNAANNYGFGMTNITDNIANLPKVTTIPQASAIPQTQPQQTVQPQNNIWDSVKQLGNDFANQVEAGTVGYAENWNDFGTNLLVNGLANTAGLSIDKIPYTRGGSVVGRKFIKQGINSVADKLKNIYYSNKKER